MCYIICFQNPNSSFQNLAMKNPGSILPVLCSNFSSYIAFVSLSFQKFKEICIIWKKERNTNLTFSASRKGPCLWWAVCWLVSKPQKNNKNSQNNSISWLKKDTKKCSFWKFLGTIQLVGPFVAVLVNKFGTRIVCIAGAVLSAFGKCHEGV